MFTAYVMRMLRYAGVLCLLHTYCVRIVCTACVLRMLTYAAVLACGDDSARGVWKDNARASVRHVRMRQVAVRPQVLHTSAYVSISEYDALREPLSVRIGIRQHT